MALAFLDRVRVGAPVIQVRMLTAWPTAILRNAVRPDAVTRWVSHAHALVRNALTTSGVPVAGPPFARFIGDGDLITVEAGFPVTAAIPDLGEVTGSGLPGGVAVVAIHHGPEGALDEAYEALDVWLRGHDYVDCGPHWEVCLPDGIEIVVPYQPR
jgi:hypothetical protein